MIMTTKVFLRVEASYEDTWKLQMLVLPVKQEGGLCLPVIFVLWYILAPAYAALLIFSNFVLISAFQLRKLQFID